MHACKRGGYSHRSDDEACAEEEEDADREVEDRDGQDGGEDDGEGDSESFVQVVCKRRESNTSDLTHAGTRAMHLVRCISCDSGPDITSRCRCLTLYLRVYLHI